MLQLFRDGLPDDRVAEPTPKQEKKEEESTPWPLYPPRQDNGTAINSYHGDRALTGYHYYYKTRIHLGASRGAMNLTIAPDAPGRQACLPSTCVFKRHSQLHFEHTFV